MFLFVKSIRFRLTLLYTVILSTVLIGSSVTFFEAFSNNLIWSSDSLLQDYARQLATEAVQLQITVDPGIKRSSANTPYAHTAAGQQHLFEIAVQSQGAKRLQRFDIPFVIS